MYLERFNLEGRVAVVTSGAQAIGFVCIEALSEAGTHVSIADCNPKASDAASRMTGSIVLADEGYTSW